MGDGRQELIVNLSGDQKNVLGFASWTQVSISAIGIVLGTIFFNIVKLFLTAIGVRTGGAILFAFICFAIVAGPFVFVAFYPIRDQQGNLLYHLNKQLIINYQFERREVGTYINYQPAHHAVNASLPYAPKYEEVEEK